MNGGIFFYAFTRSRRAFAGTAALSTFTSTPRSNRRRFSEEVLVTAGGHGSYLPRSGSRVRRRCADERDGAAG